MPRCVEKFDKVRICTMPACVPFDPCCHRWIQVWRRQVVWYVTKDETRREDDDLCLLRSTGEREQRQPVDDDSDARERFSEWPSSDIQVEGCH